MKKWYGVEFSNEVEENKFNDGIVLPKIALFRAILNNDKIETDITQCYCNTLVRVYMEEEKLPKYNNIIDLIYNVDIVQTVPCNEAIKYGYDISITVYYKNYGIYSGMFKSNKELWIKVVEIVKTLQGSNIQKKIDKAIL